MDKIVVGVIGFGTVGAGVVKILTNNREMLEKRAGVPVILKRIADLDTSSDRGVSLASGVLTANVNEVLEDPEITIVVEAIGGEKRCYLEQRGHRQTRLFFHFSGSGA
jgi:homoserine dehydrogenase